MARADLSAMLGRLEETPTAPPTATEPAPPVAPGAPPPRGGGGGWDITAPPLLATVKALPMGYVIARTLRVAGVGRRRCAPIGLDNRLGSRDRR